MEEDQKNDNKESWQDGHIKTLCAFANTEGGTLHIGIDDSGDIKGVDNPDRMLELLPNKIRGTLNITPDVKKKTKSEKTLVEITISQSPTPVSFNGRFYKRSGSNTFRLEGEELSKFLIEKSDKTWDEYVENKATMSDIDVGTITKFIDLASKKYPAIKDTEYPGEVLKKLNLIKDGKLKRAAILLFGNNPQRFYLQAQVKIGKFKDETTVKVRN